MTELTVEILRELAPQDLAAMLPTVVQMGDQTSVILRQVEGEMVELFQAGQISRVTTAALEAEFVTDHSVQAEALHRALATVLNVVTEKYAKQHQAHAEKLDAIRSYAIERHEDGDICEAGLNRFLEEFEFDPYVTRVRIDYLISGSYVVDSSSADDATEDAERYLAPDLSELDQVDDETSDYQVKITDATEL